MSSSNHSFRNLVCHIHPFISFYVSHSITGSNLVWSSAVPNPNEPNSSLTFYLHFGSTSSPQLRVLSALLIQITSEPAFNVLRTREQLGYIVSCTPWTSVGDSETGMRIVVQSERVPVYLEERVELFLDEMKEKLSSMTDEEFEQQKSGLEKRWREAVKNMSEETNRYWPQIDNGYLDFYRSKHHTLHLYHLMPVTDRLPTQGQMMLIFCGLSPRKTHYPSSCPTSIHLHPPVPRSPFICDHRNLVPRKRVWKPQQRSRSWQHRKVSSTHSDGKKILQEMENLQLIK